MLFNKYLSTVYYLSDIILGGGDTMWEKNQTKISALKYYFWS